MIEPPNKEALAAAVRAIREAIAAATAGQGEGFRSAATLYAFAEELAEDAYRNQGPGYATGLAIIAARHLVPLAHAHDAGLASGEFTPMARSVH